MLTSRPALYILTALRLLPCPHGKMSKPIMPTGMATTMATAMATVMATAATTTAFTETPMEIRTAILLISNSTPTAILMGMGTEIIILYLLCRHRSGMIRCTWPAWGRV